MYKLSSSRAHARRPPMPELLERLGAMPLYDIPDPLIGMTAEGRFRIIGMLGEGGLGSVYSAIDDRTGRETALKVASANGCDFEKSSSYLEREIRALKRLRHDNIVEFVGSGSIDGRGFLAMEHIRGILLQESRASSGPFTWEACRPVFMQMCDALQESHLKGIVHGDIKPHNIFLTMGSDGEMRVKVFDFGLAKFMDSHGDAERAPPGVIVGTIAYMAPEQVKLEDFERRADIYSLGVTMYQALSGALPYRGQSDWEIVQAKLNNEPVPVQEGHPQLSSEAGAIVMRALDRAPEKRFQTAAEMKEALMAVS